MFRSFVRNNLLFVAIGFSVAVGVGMGLAGRSFSFSPDTMSLIQFPGEIFMRLLKLMILPLVVSSLISALAQMDVKNCSKMGAITLIYYLTTVFLATILGIFLVLIIHPGDPRLSSDQATMETEKISAMDTILLGILSGDENLDNASQVGHRFAHREGARKEQVGPDLMQSAQDITGNLVNNVSSLEENRNMFPDNLVQASFERTHTVYKKSLTNQINASSQQITKEVAEQRGMNILGIIVFCVGFGIVTSHYAEKVPVMVNFFLALDKIIMKLMLSVMWFAPIGIASSICGSLLELDDIWTAAIAMTMYILTVLIGLFVHSFITIPALYVMITRKNPLNIFKYMMEGGIAAMGTSSSGAALPLSINGMEQLGGMDERVARFVLPLGATINMDGCALYEAVAVIFIAQINSVQLRFDEIITVSVTATIASLGLNAVPAGLVSILLILSTVGLPVTEVPLLFAVDWMLDRIRTSLNVFGDGFAASVVEMALRKQLKRSSIDAQENVRSRGSIP